MIRHVVFFSARDRADYQRIHDGLSLLAQIPHHSHFELGRNLQGDAISDAPVDIVVYAEFPDADALAAYKAHPLYEESIRRVRPLRDQRIAADFVAG